ncbi:hypothetical protein ACFY2H_39580 [Streptomyces griseofuscus]|uniref:hypothetical protein n=1 Tax=Streptomyces griseofuscus TaxID=146922 RepID=UPI0036CD116D
MRTAPARKCDGAIGRSGGRSVPRFAQGSAGLPGRLPRPRHGRCLLCVSALVVSADLVARQDGQNVSGFFLQYGKDANRV